VALARLLSPYSVPPFTLPFNLAAMIYLSSTMSLSRWDGPAMTPSLPQAFNDAQDLDWALFFEATFKGVGQVFLCDNTYTGAIIAVGMAFCSPTCAVCSLVGSLIGNALGVLNGADLESVYFGLWGYNSCLGMISVGGMFYVPGVGCFLLACFCAATCALIAPCVSASLGLIGVPAMTYPFCFGTLGFVLIQGSVRRSAVPVGLANMTIPEDHFRLLNMTRTVIKTFRSILAKGRQASVDTEKSLSAAYEKLDVKKIQYAFLGMADEQGELDEETLGMYLEKAGYQLPDFELSNMYGIMDYDGGGSVSFDEFVTFMAMRKVLMLKRKQLEAYFELIDSGKSGWVSFSQMNSVCEDLGLAKVTPSEMKVIFDLFAEDMNERSKIRVTKMVDLILSAVSDQLMRCSTTKDWLKRLQSQKPAARRWASDSDCAVQESRSPLAGLQNGQGATLAGLLAESLEENRRLRKQMEESSEFTPRQSPRQSTFSTQEFDEPTALSRQVTDNGLNDARSNLL